MELSRYVACICEGTAEEVIMSKLLDADQLIFTREKLLEGKIIRVRSAAEFEQLYLKKGFQEKITVLRVLDSRRERFKLDRAYEHKIDVINVITAPEIEMLIILNERAYETYKHSGKKPSDFCKENLKMRGVKSRKFVENYFSDINSLIDAIREYRRISKVRKEECSLCDLLK